MKKRKLGRQGLEVAEIGLGCMGMSEFYSGRDDAESETTIHFALDHGVTLLDTADMYGPYINEELVGISMRSWSDAQSVRGRAGVEMTSRLRRSSESFAIRRTPAYAV